MNPRWRQYLACIAFSQFLSMTAFSAAYTFMPFYFKKIGVPNDRLSWYVALFASVGNIGFAVTAPVWGSLADRYGRKLMLLRANFAAALLMPILGLITDPDLLICHRFFLGALTGTVTAAQTLVLGTAPAERRTFALGVHASAIFSGTMVGQFSGGLVSWLGFQQTFLLSGVMLAVAGLLALPVHEAKFAAAPAPKKTERKPGVFGFGKVWYLFALFAAMTIARDMDAPFIPIVVDEIMQDHDLALRWSGYIFGCCSAAAIVMGSVTGWIADRTKILTVLLVTVFLSGILRLPQIFAASVGALLIERCLLSAAICGIEPLLQSWLAAVTPEKEHGRIFGFAGLFKGIGWSVGPLVGNACIAFSGGQVRAVIAASMVLMILLVPLMKLLAAKLPPPEHRRKKA